MSKRGPSEGHKHAANGDLKKKKKKKKQRLEADFNTQLPEDELGHTIADAFNPNEDSAAKAMRFFEWFIAPIPVQVFWDAYWQKRPLVIKRERPLYFEGWYSTKDVDRVLREHEFVYTRDLDIAQVQSTRTLVNHHQVVDGKRQTLNPQGKAEADEVWGFHSRGASVRIKRPQEFSDTMWQLISLLEEHFGSGGGANVYLTPAMSQGFAPHWDDIEAFIMQIEGKKKWKLYTPQEGEFLARPASSDLGRDELGQPDMAFEVEPGDLVYFPRGWIHEAVGQEQGSVHVTVSCAQRHSWQDLLQHALPVALAQASEENVAFRRALPRDFSQYMGIVHDDGDAEDDDDGDGDGTDKADPKAQNRNQFAETGAALMELLMDHLPLDGAADKMAQTYLRDRLPPFTLPEESTMLVGGSAAPQKLRQDTSLKLRRGDAARLVLEQDAVVIYHAYENSRVYHENPLAELRFDPDLGPGLEFVLKSHPAWFTVAEIPLETKKERLVVAEALFEANILLARA